MSAINPLRSGTIFLCLAVWSVVTAAPLHEAAKQGDVEEARRLIAKDADVNALGSSDQEEVVATPLHFAALMGRNAVVELLLARGANVDATDQDYGIAPVHVAAMNGHEHTVELLAAAGADLDRATKDGATPLHFAASSGHVGVIAQLVSRGASAKLQNWGGLNALHLAAQAGCDECAATLIDGGADVDARGSLGQTPLQYAAFEGHESTVELLLSRGADVNAKQDVGVTALFLAEEAGRSDVATLLRRHGAEDPSAQNPQPAQEALAALLFDSLATLRITSRHYDQKLFPENVVRLIETPDLTRAVMNAYATSDADDLARFNLVRIANMRFDRWRNELSFSEWGAFFVRCLDDDFAWVRAEAANALGKAAFPGVVPRLVQLLEQDEADAAIEAAGALSPHTRQAPFILVGESGREDVWQRMVERGFDVDGTIDAAGWRPLGFAVAEGRRQTARMLLAHGADVDGTNSLGRTALMFASIYGYVDLATMLLDAGANPNVIPTDDTGWPALIAAAQRGHEDVVTLLLERGADAGARDLQGRTALDWAKAERHRDVVRVLEDAVLHGAP